MNWVDGMRGLAGLAAVCGRGPQRQTYLGQVAERMKGRATRLEFVMPRIGRGPWRVTGLHAKLGLSGGCLVESIKVDGQEWLASTLVPLAMFAARSEGWMAP